MNDLIEMAEYNLDTKKTPKHHLMIIQSRRRNIDRFRHHQETNLFKQDLVKQQFRPDGPNVVWAGDITYIKTRNRLGLFGNRHGSLQP
ncbi:MAG: hypothetical protein MZU97_14950 [Bacillus subtilis]|nr:hypothetical protein [Bacillus subtilis]